MRAIRILCLVGIVGAITLTPAAADNHLSRQDRGTPARIVDFGFEPTDLSVDVNGAITWTNGGGRPHTVTDRGGTFDTGPIGPDASETLSFTVPGRYAFFCRINPGRMNGVIVVRPGAEAARAHRIQALDPARPGEQLRFDPAELTVETGTAVVFANVGGKPHTLTADDGSFDTGVVPPGPQGGKFAGNNAAIVPTRPGRVPFHCEVHPAVMKGVLTVTGEPRAGPAAASAAPRATPVEIIDFAFEPGEASVAAGGKVTWRNAGEAQHTATFDDVDLDTKVITAGAEAELTAPGEPGSYSYRCDVHPGRMRGVLVIVGQNQADPTKVDAAAPAAAVGGGPGGGVSTLALATGVGGAFLGGFGISALARGRRPDVS